MEVIHLVACMRAVSHDGTLGSHLAKAFPKEPLSAGRLFFCFLR